MSTENCCYFFPRYIVQTHTHTHPQNSFKSFPFASHSVRLFYLPNVCHSIQFRIFIPPLGLPPIKKCFDIYFILFFCRRRSFLSSPPSLSLSLSSVLRFGPLVSTLLILFNDISFSPHYNLHVPVVRYHSFRWHAAHNRFLLFQCQQRQQTEEKKTGTKKIGAIFFCCRFLICRGKPAQVSPS